MPTTGDGIEVFWPLHNSFYPGVVAEKQNNIHTVVYDDGGIETLYFANETWRYASGAMLMSMIASSIRLESNAPDVLASMLQYFGNKPFLRHEAQSFPDYVLLNAYSAEETEFRRTVRAIPLAEVPNNADIIASHTVYKVKRNDDHSPRLKARIASHENGDSSRLLLRSDCSVCPPSCFRIIT